MEEFEFHVGDQIGVPVDAKFLRIAGGPYTITEITPDKYKLAGGFEINRFAEYVFPWTNDMQVGEFVPGFNPIPAPHGSFEAGEMVDTDGFGTSKRIVSGPWLIDGEKYYELQHNDGLRFISPESEFPETETREIQELYNMISGTKNRNVARMREIATKHNIQNLPRIFKNKPWNTRSALIAARNRQGGRRKRTKRKRNTRR
jgi:hypothetical protein